MLCHTCYKSPCDCRCPHAPPAMAVHHCQYCDDSIRVGEQYVEICGEHYHTGCLELLDSGEWLALLELSSETAEPPDEGGWTP